jgi:hypothetical protein
MVHTDHQALSHHGESQKTTIEEQELLVKISHTIETHMINPFISSNTEDLINIATGQKAPATDLVDARSKDLQAIEQAQDEDLSKIEIPKFETFASGQTGKAKAKAPLLQIYQDEGVVTRALCFLQDSEFRHEAFSHEWTVYPPSLFEPNDNVEQGFKMRKGNKSDFLLHLQKDIADIWDEKSALPPIIPTVYIVDAMAFVQWFMNLGATTFGDLEKRYLQKLLQLKPEVAIPYIL